MALRILYIIFDAVKKAILLYPVFAIRDVKAAIYAFDEALPRFNEHPEDSTSVFDRNPIYMLAQHYFAHYGIHFDIYQVIGFTNVANALSYKLSMPQAGYPSNPQVFYLHGISCCLFGFQCAYIVITSISRVKFHYFIKLLAPPRRKSPSELPILPTLGVISTTVFSRKCNKYLSSSSIDS